MKVMIGAKIRRERLKRNYSQEGLCKGICTVSYLSKIEQGQAEPGKELIQLLFQKLEIEYHMEEDFLQEAEVFFYELYEKLYTYQEMSSDIEVLQKKKDVYINSPFLLDALLFSAYWKEGLTEELDPYVSCMEQRQYELYLLLQCTRGFHKVEELLRLNSNAFYTTELGIFLCQKGNYVEALGLLLRGYELCAKEGYVRGMLLAQNFLGNSYAGLDKKELMLKSYKIAARIAKDLHQDDFMSEIDYNIGATFLEWGNPASAKEHLEKCVQKSAMYYHKYTLCLEKLGELEKAKEMLLEGEKKLQEVRVEGLESEPVLCSWEAMYRVVRYRLYHEEYVTEEEYERVIIECLKLLKEALPLGYLKFHIPYYVEILEKKRRYKEIYHLYQHFPKKID